MQSKFLIIKSRALRGNQTLAEQHLWMRIRRKQLGLRFNRQHIFDNKYIVDFYNAENKVVIELDGGQHCESGKDIERDEYLRQRGIIVQRFWNNEVLTNIEGCILKIMEICKRSF